MKLSTFLPAVAFVAMSSAAMAQDKIGVAECDTFVEKYEACVSGSVPEAQRAQFSGMITQMRDQFRAAAANPQSRAALGPQCTQMQQTMAQQLSAFGCRF